MEFNWSTLAWIGGLLFVYIFGLVEGRSKGYKKRKAEEEQEKKDRPAPQPEVVTMTVDDPGLLRIKSEMSGYTLDLDGARVNPVSLSSEQRKRLIEVLSIMRPWLESRPAPTPAAASVSAPLPPRPTSAETVKSKPVSVPPPAPPPTPVAQPTGPRPTIIAKEDRPPIAANSIVNQIDTILQARLEGTALNERGIFLTESPGGGVVVYVGLTRYNGIDEVPDPEIKAAIRAAITEWEDKYTPGL